MATKKPEPGPLFLKELTVSGFSLLRDLTVEFSGGLTVITGGSGAGKSLLFDALAFALGARAHRAVFASGVSLCEVRLTLDLSQQDAQALGPPWRSGDNAVFRSLSSAGRGRLEVNGVSVRAAELQSAARGVVEIAGQFESQVLFSPAAHTGLVDGFGPAGFTEQLAAYRAAYDAYQRASRVYESLKAATGRREQEIDFLRFQAGELAEAGVVPGEKGQVEAGLQLQRHAQQLVAAGLEAAQALVGDEASRGAFDLAAAAQSQVRTISKLLGNHDEAAAAESQLEEILASLRDVASWCRMFAEGVQFEPAEEQRLTERLDQLVRLERKYAVDADALEALLEEKQARLDALTGDEADPEVARQTLERAQSAVTTEGEKLGKLRVTAAARLSSAIKKNLSGLDFPNVEVEVELRPLASPGPDGLEAAELLVSLNPGEPAKPLAQVASGGEASRLLLGFKAALADSVPFRLLLLDEIEAGVGSDTGARLAEVLLRLAQGRQVIAITHLPVVAAAARHHLLVEKAATKTRTHVAVRSIDGPDRVAELARMTGGHGEESIALARRLLQARAHA